MAIDLIRDKLSLDGGVHTDTSVNNDFILNGKDRPGNRNLREAAVLVPLVDYDDGLRVLLTRRSEYLRKHAGQISFPGGSVDDTDTSPVDAALREAEEEINLDRSYVEIIGALDPYETGTGFRIQPFIGLVSPGFTLVPDENEVAEIFEPPFDYLMDPDNHERHAAFWAGRKRSYYAMPWREYYIWGATAGMLMNMYRRLYL